MSRNRLWKIVLGLGLLSSAAALAEEVEITTYYPAPFGVYDTVVAERLVDYEGGSYKVPPSLGGDWFVDPAGGGYSTTPTTPAKDLSATFRLAVGIGTNNPEGILHVKQPSTGVGAGRGILIESSSLAPTGYNTPRLTLVDTAAGGGLGGAPAWAIDNWDDRFRIFRGPNYDTIGEEYLTIVKVAAGGGYTGIGTPAPLGVLHVRSLPGVWNRGVIIEANTGAVGGSGAKNSPRIGLVDTALGGLDTAPSWYIDQVKDRFRIFRQPTVSTLGEEYFTILKEPGSPGTGGGLGYVGINVGGAPDRPLRVKGTATDVHTASFMGNNAVGVALGGYNVGGVEQSYGAIQAYVWGASPVARNLVLQEDGGNIGIGTTAPLAKVHVTQGAARGLIVEGDSTTVGPRLGLIDTKGATVTTAPLWTIEELADRLRITRVPYLGAPSGGAEFLTILSSGNVGIGTVAPTSKLHVNGGNAQADDFCLDPGTDPKKCLSYVVPSTGKGAVFGGMYQHGNDGCEAANPLTGACSCPTGFTASSLSITHEDGGGHDENFFCYKR